MARIDSVLIYDITLISASINVFLTVHRTPVLACRIAMRPFQRRVTYDTKRVNRSVVTTRTHFTRFIRKNTREPRLLNTS